jgi:hypothetical protein
MPGNSRSEWTHGNAVVELSDGNILLSMRHISTIVWINHQTNEIDWELGPPPLSGSHGVNPIANGNYLLFDNGPYRVDQWTIAPVNANPFSRVLEVEPVTNDIVWNYTDPARASLWGPTLGNAQRLPNGNYANPFSRVLEVEPVTNDIVWNYTDPARASLWGPTLGNAQRLPNGNTLINEAVFGRFLEVTPDGSAVWEYVNPYFGPSTAPPAAQTNSVFRAYRYTPDEIDRARAG